MTREDAIDIIKSECYVFNPLNFDRSTMVNTALDMAVKALSAEPIEDCISREAAIKVFGDVHPMDYNTQAYITNIQNLPSVIPEQEPCDDAISRQAVIDACDQSINIFDATDRIKELPSVKPKVKECEDCVSRKWLKNAIYNFYKGLIHTPTEEDIQAYIDVAPSVKPQPNTGHWIHFSSSDDCSECGYSTGKYESPSKYCPNCGRRMVENEVEE